MKVRASSRWAGSAGGAFVAEEVLAKHDENYMPPEVFLCLKKGGNRSHAHQIRTETMIPELGHFALILALCLALAQGILPLIGAHRSNLAWMALARPAATGQFVFLRFLSESDLLFRCE